MLQLNERYTKMKTTTLHLLILMKLIGSFKIRTPELQMKNCLRVILDEQYHTIFIEEENSTDTLMKECIIKNIHINQSIILLKGLESYEKTDPLANNKRNLIVMIRTLNDKLINIFTLSAYNTITYHWNLLYIVVTEKDDIYKCIDGQFHKNTFEYIRNFMNDLWNRFEMMKVVLLFPYSCPHSYIIYGENIQTNMPVLNRTVRLIRPKGYNELSSSILKSTSQLSHDFPVKVGIFPRFPTSIMDCENIETFINFNGSITHGFCGLDGLVLQDAIQYFKFNATFTTERRCNEYGFSNCSKEAFGSLGCVIDKTLDISFNSRFMVMYPNERFHYLPYVMHDSLCALMPVPGIYELWHYPHMPLDSIIWVTVIGKIVIMATVAWIFGKVMHKMTGRKPIKLQTFILDFTTSTLCGFSLKKYKGFYILRGLCLGFSIIILSYYQGYINYSFTTYKRYEKITTLQELYDFKLVLYTSPAVRDLLKPLKNPENLQEVNFLKRAKLQQSTDIGIVLERPNAVTLGRFTDVRSEILLRYRDNSGKPMIYVVDECFRVYYLSYICRFDFPFTKQFKLFMDRLMAAGLPDKYYRWTRRTLGLPDVMPKDPTEPRPIAKINMRDQRIAFGMLLCGYFVSTIAFLIEKWMGRRNVANATRR